MSIESPDNSHDPLAPEWVEDRFGDIRHPDDIEFGNYQPREVVDVVGADRVSRGDEHIPGRDSNWRLSDEDREIGRKGVDQARRALRGEIDQ